MSTVRVAIAGATGYAGEELIRLLLTHPHVRLTCLAASAKRERPVSVSDVYPHFSRQLDLPVESLDLARLSEADAVFLALPHGAAKDLVPSLLDSGKRVIDLSGDFRLKDPAAYPQWYQFTHTHPELLTDPGVVYGLTEFHREELRAARLVANPGCYATSVLLAVLPLCEAGVMDEPFFFVDAKSGYTGAGRKVKEDASLWGQTAENLRAYKINAHQHMPEILQEIARAAGRDVGLNFVPQVLPIARGLISMVYLKTSKTREAIREAYEKRYSAQSTPFVRVRWDALPQLKDVVKTNYCDIGLVQDPAHGSLIIGSALDNLTKGAAGQAIQNFNVMHGFPETDGLR